jgi:Holliday junction resolvase-like predicted endonuclease
MGTHKPIRDSSGETRRKWLARGWLVVGLAVSAVLFVRAMPHSPLRGTRPHGQPTVAFTTTTSAQSVTASVGVRGGHTETVYVRRLITQPIETIRVGQRVLGTNPDRDEVEAFEEPNPMTWRTVEVEQIKPSGKRLYATLLRPLEWIEEELDPETNTIELDLPELGAEGTARVLRIGPCPPIASGPGQVVTATFKHEPDGDLVTVKVGNDEIGCTANHPFWSEDRQEFVEAGQLRPGERVRTRLEEVAAVVAIKPRPPTNWVYNLEVAGEHVYEVSPSGVLVHNGCLLKNGLLGDKAEKFVTQVLRKKGWNVRGSIQNSSGHGIDLVAVRNVKGKLQIIFVEVKANTSQLSKAQKKGAASFVQDRLRRAIDPTHKKYWKSLDAETRTFARFVAENVKGQPIRGVVARAKVVATEVVDVTFKKW